MISLISDLQDKPELRPAEKRSFEKINIGQGWQIKSKRAIIFAVELLVSIIREAMLIIRSLLKFANIYCLHQLAN